MIDGASEWSESVRGPGALQQAVVSSRANVAGVGRQLLGADGAGMPQSRSQCDQGSTSAYPVQHTCAVQRAVRTRGAPVLCAAQQH
jgi:hypothetical protein